MRFFTFLTIIGTVVAAPLLATPRVHTPHVRRSSDSDPSIEDIWQLAVYIENLEIGLYKAAFAKFSKQDFANAGFDAFYYKTLQDILHEHRYQANLIRTQLIGSNRPIVPACNYSFSFKTISSFADQSAVLESFATSFYSATIPYIAARSVVEDVSPTYEISYAGGIMAMDAKHTAFQRLSLKKNITETNFFPSIGLNEAYSYAYTYAASCPKSQYKLPFRLLQPITTNATQVRQGQAIDFYSPLSITSDYYALLIYDQYNFPADIVVNSTNPGHFSVKTLSGTYGAVGQTYMVITSTDNSEGIMEETVIAGPAVFQVTL